MRRMQGSAGGHWAGASHPMGDKRMSRGPRGSPEGLRLLGLGLGTRCHEYIPEPCGAGARCRHRRGDAAAASSRMDPQQDAESSLRVGTEAPTGAFGINFTVSASPKSFLFLLDHDSSLFPLAFPSSSLQSFATERGEDGDKSIKSLSRRPKFWGKIQQSPLSSNADFW